MAERGELRPDYAGQVVWDPQTLADPEDELHTWLEADTGAEVIVEYALPLIGPADIVAVVEQFRQEMARITNHAVVLQLRVDDWPKVLRQVERAEMSADDVDTWDEAPSYAYRRRLSESQHREHGHEHGRSYGF